MKLANRIRQTYQVNSRGEVIPVTSIGFAMTRDENLALTKSALKKMAPELKRLHQLNYL